MRIIFMGSSSFAIPAFNSIIAEKKHKIIAVYTKEPSQSGRNMRLKTTVIHDLAVQNQIPVFTPKNFNQDSDQQVFKSFEADVAIVISYGILLPKSILEATKFGCFNLHPSNLPKWRGAAPLQRCLMAGEKETAVCIIKMDEGLDSGDIVKERHLKLSGSENFIELHNLTAEIGATQIIELLEELQLGCINYRKQDSSQATYSKKISKDECLINWNNFGFKILCQIRGLSGNFGAHFFYEGEQFKILEAEFLGFEKLLEVNCGQHAEIKKKTALNQENIGLVLSDQFEIGCIDGIIKPKIIQRAGKKPMTINEFLLGFKPKIGMKLL